MKILLTREMFHPTGWEYGQDYLSDGLLHGLRKLFGDSVVDCPRLWYMYRDEFGPGKKILEQSVYGRGFTLYGMMDEGNIDRTDIEAKIVGRFFDLVIMTRIDFGSPYFALIMQHYRPHEIVVLDGQDGTNIYYEGIGKSIYFKRELVSPVTGVLPISFGFPREKIQKPMEKVQMMSYVDPRDRNTYAHWREDTYYADYGRSLFGITICKIHQTGGWDCMRHYEIMACRAIPLFLDLADCPEYTCTTLPKKLLLDVLHKVQNCKYFDYKEVEETLHQYFINNCLTEHLAEYVLDQYTKAKINSFISNI